MGRDTGEVSLSAVRILGTETSPGILLKFTYKHTYSFKCVLAEGTLRTIAESTGEHYETKHPSCWHRVVHQLHRLWTGPSTRNEIRKAIQFLKYGKAAGRDVIPPELLKFDFNMSIDMLEKYLWSVYGKTKKCHHNGKKGLLWKSLKKVKWTYRGIFTVGDTVTAGKMLNRIILQRLKEAYSK